MYVCVCILKSMLFVRPCDKAFAFLMHISKVTSQRRYSLKQSRAETVFAQYLYGWVFLASKLFEILSGTLFASFLPERCVKSGHVMALSPMRLHDDVEKLKKTETVHRCRLIPAGRSLHPFADLIYGAILMSKNTTHRPCVPPRDSKRFLAFLLTLSSPFIVVSRPVCTSLSFLRTCVYEYRVLAHPQSACRLDARENLCWKIHACFHAGPTYVRVRRWSCTPIEYDCIADIINRRRVLGFSVSFGELRTKLASSPTSSKHNLLLPVACALLSRMVIAACHSRFDPFRPNYKNNQRPASLKNRMRIERANLRAKSVRTFLILNASVVIINLIAMIKSYSHGR